VEYKLTVYWRGVGRGAKEHLQGFDRADIVHPREPHCPIGNELAVEVTIDVRTPLRSIPTWGRFVNIPLEKGVKLNSHTGREAGAI